MKIYTEILGNLHDPAWVKKTQNAAVERIDLDQWTAQKSRFVAPSDRANEYAVALKRHTQLLDGDILEYLPEERKVVAIRIRLNDVLVADLGTLVHEAPERIVRIAVELGHAIGNQHWPAVVKGTKVYVPLTVDKKVMESVMRTHHIESVACSFQPGSEVIPYLAPHEIRRLFGGTGPDSDVHHHHESTHAHMHAHTYEHAHEHTHGQEPVHMHEHREGLAQEHGQGHAREQALGNGREHDHAHGQSDGHGHEPGQEHAREQAPGNGREHEHAHGQSDGHGHAFGNGQGHEHEHGHGQEPIREQAHPHASEHLHEHIY